MLKLTIEMVPQTCWGRNLRSRMPSADWDRVRKFAYVRAGNKCEVCGGKGMLHCHERWEYDGGRKVQKCVGLVALCVHCHGIKHYGRSSVECSQEQLGRLHKHFMKVNKVGKEVLDKHIRESVAAWMERSESEWSVDYGGYDRWQDVLLGKV